MWVSPLLSEDIVPPSRRHSFVQTVFSNIATIHQRHARLAKRLRKRQLDHPIVMEIGDTLLSHVDDFCLIIDYGAKQHEAKFFYEKERYLNPKFDAFAQVSHLLMHPCIHKYSLSAYLVYRKTSLVTQARIKWLFDETHYQIRSLSTLTRCYIETDT